MANFSKFTRKRLGEILVNEGLITTGQIQEALEAQGNTGEMLGETLVRLGYITEEKIASTLADQFQLPFIQASSYDIEKSMSKVIPVQYMLDHLFVPLDTFGDVLIIAIAGLLTDDVISEIRDRTKCEVFVYIATMGDVRKALEKMYPELFQLGPSQQQVTGIGYTEAISQGEPAVEETDDGFDSAEAALDAILPDGEAATAPAPTSRKTSPAGSGRRKAAGAGRGGKARRGANSKNNNNNNKKGNRPAGARPAPQAGGGEEEDDSWESLFDEADESVRKDLTDE